MIDSGVGVDTDIILKNIENENIDKAKINKLEIDSLIPNHYGFTLNSGSKHINMAAEALKELFIPRMIF